MSITILVLIGSIVLIGVVVNNGILMVDYINHLMLRGQDRRKTVVVACMVRLHPILMSTITTVLAVLPICLGWGSGAELRKALGLTIAAGLIASLFFTLFLVPVLYEMAAGRQRVTDASS
jgi:HAE1 family hydrophobic/amphiphilic exporter-1